MSSRAPYRFASMAAFLAGNALILGACSAAPDLEGAEGVGFDEQPLGATVVELVPADDVVRTTCRAEINREHCGDKAAEKAVAACVAKLPPGHACKHHSAACFVREGKAQSCKATAEAYPRLAACAEPITRNCAHYAQCVDAAIACGENGYALGFGERYCNAFRRTDFSEKGVAWVDSVMLCLQRALVPEVEAATQGFAHANRAPAPAATCSALLDTAFATHPACYTQPEASICFLPPSDLAKVFGVIGAKEVFTARTSKQIATTITTCVGQLARAALGLPVSAAGGHKASPSDEAARAMLPGELEAQHAVWLDYAKQYGVSTR